MHFKSNPATIIHGEIIALMMPARSLRLTRLLLPLPTGCLASC